MKTLLAHTAGSVFVFGLLIAGHIFCSDFVKKDGNATWRSEYFYITEQMHRGEILGSLEYVILLAVVRLGGTGHGTLVRREIEACTGRDVSIGAVYGTLERLERKGYVSSRRGEPTPERGGRAKRLFHIEAAGRRALRVSDDTLRRMTAGLRRGWGTV